MKTTIQKALEVSYRQAFTKAGWGLPLEAIESNSGYATLNRRGKGQDIERGVWAKWYRTPTVNGRVFWVCQNVNKAPNLFMDDGHILYIYIVDESVSPSMNNAGRDFSFLKKNAIATFKVSGLSFSIGVELGNKKIDSTIASKAGLIL